MEGLGKILDLRYGNLKEKNARISGSINRDYDYGKSDLVQSANGHFSDSGKMPWHPTFSNESSYSQPGSEGGEWNQTGINSYSYTPSKYQIQSGFTKGLGKYMKNIEPDVELKAPVPYDKKIFNN